MKLLNKIKRKTEKQTNNSKDAAKERLHLVLMQDRANVSADFLELMKQEIIEVIKKYIEVDESAIDVRLTNKENADGTNGAPALYANIPIMNIKDEVRQNSKTNTENDNKRGQEENEIIRKQKRLEESIERKMETIEQQIETVMVKAEEEKEKEKGRKMEQQEQQEKQKQWQNHKQGQVQTEQYMHENIGIERKEENRKTEGENNTQQKIEPQKTI
ncbi:MAG: cell division topological specificity factor MinE [Clostridia bacterium]|nr:cell division topological specificity factor MinE [Clostridia bacterium]